MNSETELFDLEEQCKEEDGDWHTREWWDNYTLIYYYSKKDQLIGQKKNKEILLVKFINNSGQ
jgi:hypothetical protein